MGEEVQEADSESADDEDDNPVPDSDDEDEEDPFGCNGAVNPAAAAPASRRMVKPQEKGEGDDEEEDDDDEDDDIEVVTGAGNATTSSAFLSVRSGQDTTKANTKANQGVTTPAPKPAFRNAFMSPISEATTLAAGQNQGLMDALGAIRVDRSTEASKPGVTISAWKKNLMGSVPAGNAFATSSSTFNPPAAPKKAVRLSQQLTDFGLRKASQHNPNPSASNAAKGKEKENSNPKLNVLQDPRSRQILGPDGLHISTSTQKEAVKEQSILDAVPTKAFKPADNKVFKPVTNTALRPTGNNVRNHFGNDKKIFPSGSKIRPSQALAAALDDADKNMEDDSYLPVDPRLVQRKLPSPRSALPTGNNVLKHAGNDKMILPFDGKIRPSQALAAALDDADMNMEVDSYLPVDLRIVQPKPPLPRPALPSALLIEVDMAAPDSHQQADHEMDSVPDSRNDAAYISAAPSVSVTKVLGKRRNYEDPKEEDNPENAFTNGHEDRTRSKKSKLDYELIFAIDLETITRRFARLSIEDRARKVVRKVTSDGMGPKFARAGPARQAMKNHSYFASYWSVPPTVERPPVLVAPPIFMSEPVPLYEPAPMYAPVPVYEPAPVYEPPPVYDPVPAYEPVAVGPSPIHRPLLEYIERGRLALAELEAYRQNNPPPDPRDPYHWPFARQARETAHRYRTGVLPLPPPRNRLSTPEYNDAVAKMRPGAALSPPLPKKMEGERVEDEDSEVKVRRGGIFGNLRRLFSRR